jgi:hypothetical protein
LFLLFVIVLSMRTQEAQLRAQLFYLFEQAEQSLEQRYISAVIDPNMLDAPHGVNSLFREGHDLRASFRKDFLISASLAFLATPRMS